MVMLQSCLAEVLNFKKVERKVVKGLLHGTRKWEKKNPSTFHISFSMHSEPLIQSIRFMYCLLSTVKHSLLVSWHFLGTVNHLQFMFPCNQCIQDYRTLTFAWKISWNLMTTIFVDISNCLMRRCCQVSLIQPWTFVIDNNFNILWNYTEV